MKVTAVEEYGLRCMMQMAGAGAGRPLTVAEIAEKEGLSSAYVAKLMGLLREGGLVESVRGRSGGYVVARPPERINLSEILAALGGHLFEEHYCERFPGEEESCVHLGECSIRSLWGTLESVIEQVLSRTSLVDLMKSEQCLTEHLMQRQRRRLPMADEGPARVPVIVTPTKETPGGRRG